MNFILHIAPYGIATHEDLQAMYERKMINRCRAMRGMFLLMPFKLLDIWWP
jgi:hypothetical protein